MSISYVRTVGTAFSTGNAGVTSVVLTVGGGITTTVGNHLILVDSSYYATTLPNITDPKGNAWQWDVQDNARMFLASCKITNPLLTGDTITMTYAGGNSAHGFAILEVAGLHSTQWFENKIGYETGSSSATESPYTPSVSVGGSFILGAQFCQVSMPGVSYEALTPAWTVAATYIANGNASSDYGFNSAYRIPPLGGPMRVKSTFSGPRPWYAIVASYRAVFPEDVLSIGNRRAY